MALKKSDLYSSLWASADELRGGMDASQYKDYILTLLFVKYVSDKAKVDKSSLIEVPEGGSFDDMLAAKGDKETGDRFNKIVAKLAAANNLEKVIDQADFNDGEKLGDPKAMVVPHIKNTRLRQRSRTLLVLMMAVLLMMTATPCHRGRSRAGMRRKNGLAT